MTSGYSDTPLAKKLTLKDGMCVWFDGMPPSVRAEIDEAGLDLADQDSPDQGMDAAHIFVTNRASLISRLCDLRDEIARDGQVWVSWPKKASGVETEIDEHVVREEGLAAGFVDTKKCAVDDIWSGLKFVIPKMDR